METLLAFVSFTRQLFLSSATRAIWQYLRRRRFMEKEHTHTHLNTHTYTHTYTHTHTLKHKPDCSGRAMPGPGPGPQISVLIIDRLFIYSFIVMTYDFFSFVSGCIQSQNFQKKKKQNAQKNEQQITIEILQVFVVSPLPPCPYQ